MQQTSQNRDHFLTMFFNNDKYQSWECGLNILNTPNENAY